MEEEQAKKAVEVVEAWWQERRSNTGMDTEEHNRELQLVEDLKARILATVPQEEKVKPAKK